MMNTDDTGLNSLSERIIGCAFTVSNALGWAFLRISTKTRWRTNCKAGLKVAQQRGVVVMYDGVIVGEHAVDLLVEETVIVEPKTVRAWDDVHSAQCLNYLKATGRRLCLLINFWKPRVEIKRPMLGP